MIESLYEWVRKLKKKNVWYWSYAYKICKLFVNLFFPLSQLKRKENGLDSMSKIIVSITTFPQRINGVWMTIASLLNQTKKPYKIILWLAEEQFKDKKLPLSLRNMEKRGLEIKYSDDLKPHKKYYYTMKEYPDYYVVTADDDILYPENHLETLWKGHEEYPECVVCNWSHKISFNMQGNFTRYNTWKNNSKEDPSHMTLAIGCNGVLYPPHCLSERVFDKQLIIEYALFTDDLWLKCMEVLKNTKVVNCNVTSLIYFSNINLRGEKLWKQNAGDGQNNDNVWKKLMEIFPEVRECLQNCIELQ